MKFIDELKITLASGKGGAGSVSFRREAMEPRGGPDGGDGGRGGDVILKVSNQLNSLVDLRRLKKYSAEPGNPGQDAKCSGAAGKDLLIQVPRGTLVRSCETGEILVDMTELDEHILLKGGRGGKGNTFFKTSINQAPDYAQPGEPSQEIEVILELKLLADVGIIGFPNAGKSTLISKISASKPKIADYPFTTLTPNLGVVRVDEFSSFVVADIPGLIPGAAQGAGLGIKFLKHIERTKFFVHLIDVSPVGEETPASKYKAIQHEIVEYEKTQAHKDGFVPLSTRPQIVVFNKIDTLMDSDREKLVREFIKTTSIEPHLISAVAGIGVKELISKMAKLIFSEEA